MNADTSQRIDLCWLAFFSRVLVGILFAMAGYQKVFVLTASHHARAFFVEPYADTWIPSALLWLLGLMIPFIELIGGVLLIAGLFRSFTAVTLSFLLLAVTYGHALKDPFFDVTTHILPRFILILPSLLLKASTDRWSVDYWLSRRRRLSD